MKETHLNRSFKQTLKYMLIAIVISAFVISCGNETKEEPPTVKILETKKGKASYYGRFFDGKKTASGEIFDSKELVAAHPSYPMGTMVHVTNLENDDTVTVRIIDRGPTKVNREEGVIIDLSRGAGEKLHMISDGRVNVRVDVMEWGTE